MFTVPPAASEIRDL